MGEEWTGGDYVENLEGGGPAYVWTDSAGNKLATKGPTPPGSPAGLPAGTPIAPPPGGGQYYDPSMGAWITPQPGGGVVISQDKPTEPISAVELINPEKPSEGYYNPMTGAIIKPTAGGGLEMVRPYLRQEGADVIELATGETVDKAAFQGLPIEDQNMLYAKGVEGYNNGMITVALPSGDQVSAVIGVPEITLGGKSYKVDYDKDGNPFIVGLPAGSTLGTRGGFVEMEIGGEKQVVPRDFLKENEQIAGGEWVPKSMFEGPDALPTEITDPITGEKVNPQQILRTQGTAAFNDWVKIYEAKAGLATTLAIQQQGLDIIKQAKEYSQQAENTEHNEAMTRLEPYKNSDDSYDLSKITAADINNNPGIKTAVGLLFPEYDPEMLGKEVVLTDIGQTPRVYGDDGVLYVNVAGLTEKEIKDRNIRYLASISSAGRAALVTEWPAAVTNSQYVITPMSFDEYAAKVKELADGGMAQDEINQHMQRYYRYLPADQYANVADEFKQNNLVVPQLSKWQEMTPWHEEEGEKGSALEHFAFGAGFIVPGVHTYMYSRDMSPGWIAASAALDVITLAPLLKSAGTLLSRSLFTSIAPGQIVKSGVGSIIREEKINIGKITYQALKERIGPEAAGAYKSVVGNQAHYIETLDDLYRSESRIGALSNLGDDALKTIAKLRPGAQLGGKLGDTVKAMGVEIRAGTRADVSEYLRITKRAATLENTLKESAEEFTRVVKKSGKFGADDPAAAGAFKSLPDDIVRNTKQTYKAIRDTVLGEKGNVAELEKRLGGVEAALRAAQKKNPMSPHLWSDLLNEVESLRTQIVFERLRSSASKIYGELLETRRAAASAFGPRRAQLIIKANKLESSLWKRIRGLELEHGKEYYARVAGKDYPKLWQGTPRTQVQEIINSLATYAELSARLEAKHMSSLFKKIAKNLKTKNPKVSMAFEDLSRKVAKTERLGTRKQLKGASSGVISETGDIKDGPVFVLKNADIDDETLRIIKDTLEDDLRASERFLKNHPSTPKRAMIEERIKLTKKQVKVLTQDRPKIQPLIERVEFFTGKNVPATIEKTPRKVAIAAAERAAKKQAEKITEQVEKRAARLKSVRPSINASQAASLRIIQEIMQKQLAGKATNADMVRLGQAIQAVNPITIEEISDARTPIAQVKQIERLIEEYERRTSTFPGVKAETAVSPQISPYPMAKTQPEPKPETKPKTEAKPKTETKPQPKLKALPETKPALRTNIKTRIPVKVRGIPKKIILPPSDKAGVSLSKKDAAASIAWRQGKLKQGDQYIVVHPPYGPNDKFWTTKVPEGVKIVDGPRSAYDSLRRITKGKLPEEIMMDLGIMDIKITAVSEVPKMRFIADPEQKTTLGHIRVLPRRRSAAPRVRTSR